MQHNAYSYQVLHQLRGRTHGQSTEEKQYARRNDGAQQIYIKCTESTAALMGVDHTLCCIYSRVACLGLKTRVQW